MEIHILGRRVQLLGTGGKVHRALCATMEIYRQWKLRRKYGIGGGKNKGLHLYIIGITQENEGFFSMVNKVVAHILYAVEHGMVPVVNWRDFCNPFNKEGVDPWTEFFEPPCGISIL